MSDGPLSPEEVAHRGFGTMFRGFDTGEVRGYLQRVANDLRASTGRERDLHRRLADAEHRAAHPVLEGDALTRALGDEMGRILATAQEAANGLKVKAEENAARILREAHDQAQRIRAQAEAILAARTEEADAEAAEISRAAESEAAGVVERAHREATAAMAEVEGEARQLVNDAQAARARVLGDLTRRRRLLQTQVEQLRAGRERLLEAYRKVRSTTDEVVDELRRVEDEAREAAGAAGQRVAAEPGGEDLDDVRTVSPDEPAVAEGAGVGPGGGGATGPGGRREPPGAEATGAGGVRAGGATQGEVPAGTGSHRAAPAAPLPPDAEVATRSAGQSVEAGEAAASSAGPAMSAPATPATAGSDGTTGTATPPHVVSTRPGAGGDRRPLRLLRRQRADGRPVDVAPAPSGDEGVRVLPPGRAPAAVAPPGRPEPSVPGPLEDDERSGAGAPPHVETAAPPPAPVGHDQAVVPTAAAASTAAPAPAADAVTGDAEVAAASVAGVDDLFARIRAGRADAVARAHKVLAADPGASVDVPPVPSPGPSAGPEPASGDAGQSGPAEGETLLQRRDAAVEGIEPKLARKLKRALQDEQNEVLDSLRSAKAGAAPEAALPTPDVQASRYRKAADELLRTAAACGATFVAPRDPGPGASARAGVPDVTDVVADLGASLAEPLRRALERALRGDGSDQGAVVERIGAAYRECKAQRIEGLAGDAVTAAFSRGALTAMPAGGSSRWVVDDDGRPCPDCDDNALAGPTPAGEAFPTGQRHPPAHAGCRCLLAPAELAAAVPGAG